MARPHAKVPNVPSVPRVPIGWVPSVPEVRVPRVPVVRLRRMIHTKVTTTKTRAFSRVRLRPPIARPRASHDVGSRTPGQNPRDEPDAQADEEHVEHGLLQQRIEEDGRRVERQAESRDPSGAAAEQPRGRQPHQHARAGADDRLRDAHDQEIPPGDRVQQAEKVRIQRRLIEDVAADPLAAGDAPGPFVVAASVAQQDVEEGRRAEQGDVREANRDRDRENRRRPSGELGQVGLVGQVRLVGQVALVGRVGPVGRVGRVRRSPRPVRAVSVAFAPASRHRAMTVMLAHGSREPGTENRKAATGNRQT